MRKRNQQLSPENRSLSNSFYTPFDTISACAVIKEKEEDIIEYIGKKTIKQFINKEGE